jgi:acyl-CoA thioester hydrolase
MDVDFLKPAGIDDIVVVRTQPGSARARIVLRQSVERGPEVLVAATVTVVLVGPGGRVLRLPAHIRAAFGGGAVSAGS